jgi:hypothetical protein
MVPHLGDGDWRSFAEQASKEMDSARLSILIEKLCCALDGERKQKFRLVETPRENEPGSFLGD